MFKKQVKYVYLNIDKRLSPKCINYYYEHLTKARDMGFPSLYDWLVATYKKTGSQTRTASILGVDQRTIGHWLKCAGIPIKPRGGANNVKEKKI